MNARLGKVGLYVIILVAAVFLDTKSIMAEDTDQENVNSVDVQLSISGQLYEGLQERIEYSISQVGDKILLSRPVSLLQANQEAVKTAIINIFSKVLNGFKLESVDLLIGNHTKVVIHITPIPPLISAIRVNLRVQKLAPEIMPYVNGISPKVEGELNRIFAGLPVAAMSWSEEIFAQVADYILEREFPGFESRFSLQPGETAELNVDLTQQGPVVGEIQVNYTAKNIPVLFVRLFSREYAKRFNILEGLPVEFVIQNQPELEEYLIHYVNNFSGLKNAGMPVDLKIKPGVKTQIGLNVQSQVFLLNFEARYYFDLRESFSNCQTVFGYHTESFELFSRWRWWGENRGETLSAGCMFPIAQNLTCGLEYEFGHLYKSVVFHYQFDRGDYFNLKLGLADSPTEAIIGIKLNELADLELVDHDNSYGIQTMFHF